MLGILTDQVLKLQSLCLIPTKTESAYINGYQVILHHLTHPTSFNPLELTSKL